MSAPATIEYGVTRYAGYWRPCVWVDGRSVQVPSRIDAWVFERNALVYAERIAADEAVKRPGSTVKERRR